jgi:cyanophycinase-like exopeptidase
VTGPLALHGGGEFLPGDEPFLGAILRHAAERPGRDESSPVRVMVVPTATARHGPERAAAFGSAALERVAASLGLPAQVEAAMVVDASSAADARLATSLANADLIHLPGGDPDVIPSLYPDTPAWSAMHAAWSDGAVLAGASAGAMALAGLTWTPNGFVPGLGLVPGLLVVPHADARSWAETARRFGTERPPDLGALGLAERTGVIGRPGAPWLVVGEGEARWLAPGAAEPRVAVAGETLSLHPG